MDKLAVDCTLAVLWLNSGFGLHGRLVILIIARLGLDFLGMSVSFVRAFQGFTPGSGDAGKIKFHFDVLAVYSLFITNFWLNTTGDEVLHGIAAVALVIACAFSVLSLSHHLGRKKGHLGHASTSQIVDSKAA